MNSERHALAILNAIQAAEKDGYMVEVVSTSRYEGLQVADYPTLVQPTEEDEPWGMVAP